MNFCKDCRFHITIRGSIWFLIRPQDLCSHPKAAELADPVLGRPSDCMVNRRHEIACGPQGKWFEPKAGPTATDGPNGGESDGRSG